MNQDSMELTPAELEFLDRRGIDAAESRRQLALLRAPLGYAELVRPCTPGDGIETLGPGRRAALIAAHEQAACAGRLSAFVPASGAATRMFKEVSSLLARRPELTATELQEAVDEGAADARSVAVLLRDLDQLALAEEIEHELSRRGEDMHALLDRGRFGEVLGAMLNGLRCADRPKGLLPFHRSDHGARTAFEEHLIEAADVLCDADGVCRLHFTVTAEHVGGFEILLKRVASHYQQRFGVRFEVGFSTQSAATDALALTPDGRPFRTDDGRLLLRPAGHGALLDNLDALAADLILIKNIDNVVPEERKAATHVWERLLLGELTATQQRVRQTLADLDDDGGAPVRESARELLTDVLGVAVVADADAPMLIELLDRPLRVCGMVPNTGEPGGGPFWVRGNDGELSRQIVEGAEIDGDSPTQDAILRASTHFNPVFMACAVRDRHDRPYDLSRFVDPGASIVTIKSIGGRELKALERPGLWNGSMARWNTLFVEVPLEVFNPVKTINDLVRPEHQPSL